MQAIRAGVTVTAIVVFSLTACVTHKDEQAVSGDTSGNNSCAGIFTYQGRNYVPVVNFKFTVTEELGDATNEPCDDTGQKGQTDDPVTKRAYRVEGVSPEVAIAVGDTAKGADLFAVAARGKLPPELQEFTKNP
uniref:DUF6281 family protein n=1 Tax=Streptomyces sp. NBC_01393 TaxID=2903851 RepID=A0AAU3I9P0_9ACTN